VDLLWARVRDLVGDTPGVPPDIALNRPFATGGVLRQYGQLGGVPAIGVEINRALYLDDAAPALSPRHESIERLADALRGFSTDLLALLTR
jgi:N-formylglutamate amidohydrolase